MLTLVKIVLLGLNLSLSNSVMFPLGTGNSLDTLEQIWLVDAILNRGHLPDGWFYASFPAEHLLAVAGSLVLGQDAAMTYYYLGSLIIPLGSVLIFILGSTFADTRVALLAALFYVSSDALLFFSAHPNQMNLYIFLLVTIVAVTLFCWNRVESGFWVLWIIVGVAFILSHHLGSALFILLLGTLRLTTRLSAMATFARRQVDPSLLLFSTSMFAYWLYQANYVELPAFVLKQYLEILANPLKGFGRPVIYDSYPVNLLVLNTLGSGILMVLCTLGLFYRLRERSAFGDVILSVAALLGLVAVGGVFLDAPWLPPTRIFAIAQALVTPLLAAWGLTRLVATLGEGKAVFKGGMVMLAMGLFVFFSASSAVAGFDTSPYVIDEPHYKLRRTLFEESAQAWLNRYESTISTTYNSFGFLTRLAPNAKIEYVPNKDGHIELEAIRRDSLVVFSHYEIEEGYAVGTQIFKRFAERSYLRYEEAEPQRLSKFARYYDNGKISVYYRR